MYLTRNKNKIPIDFGLNDAYKFYKQNTEKPVNYKIYSSLVKEFNERVIRNIIFNSETFRIPGRLGDIRIKKFKCKLVDEEGNINRNFLKPDWKKTWKIWKEIYPDKTEQEIKEIKNKKIVYHLNNHTDGYYFRFYWNKATCNLKNNTAYSFKPTRTNKQILASAIKDEDTIVGYYE